VPNPSFANTDAEEKDNFACQVDFTLKVIVKIRPRVPAKPGFGMTPSKEILPFSPVS